MVCHLRHWLLLIFNEEFASRWSFIHSFFSLRQIFLCIYVSMTMLDTEVFKMNKIRIKVSTFMFCQIATQTIIKVTNYDYCYKGSYSLWNIVMVVWHRVQGKLLWKKGCLHRHLWWKRKKRQLYRDELLDKGEAKSSKFPHEEEERMRWWDLAGGSSRPHQAGQVERSLSP